MGRCHQQKRGSEAHQPVFCRCVYTWCRNLRASTMNLSSLSLSMPNHSRWMVLANILKYCRAPCTFAAVSDCCKRLSVWLGVYRSLNVIWALQIDQCVHDQYGLCSSATALTDTQNQLEEPPVHSVWEGWRQGVLQAHSANERKISGKEVWQTIAHTKQMPIYVAAASLAYLDWRLVRVPEAEEQGLPDLCDIFV